MEPDAQQMVRRFLFYAVRRPYRPGLPQAERNLKETLEGKQDMKEFFSGLIAALGGVAAFLFGPWDGLLTALLIAVAIDYLTGFAGAAVQGALSSEVGFRGLLRKVTIFLIIGLATALDRLVLSTNGALRAAVCLFYIVNEGLSILENTAKIGLPLPEALKNALTQLSEKKC